MPPRLEAQTVVPITPYRTIIPVPIAAGQIALFSRAVFIYISSAECCDESDSRRSSTIDSLSLRNGSLVSGKVYPGDELCDCEKEKSAITLVSLYVSIVSLVEFKSPVPRVHANVDNQVYRDSLFEYFISFSNNVHF